MFLQKCKDTVAYEHELLGFCSERAMKNTRIYDIPIAIVVVVIPMNLSNICINCH